MSVAMVEPSKKLLPTAYLLGAAGFCVGAACVLGATAWVLVDLGGAALFTRVRGHGAYPILFLLGFFPFLIGGAGLLIGRSQDILRREALEAERQGRLAAENSNRARGAFLAAMSHEIRTPMNGILGMTSMLRDTRLSPDQREFVETIHTAGETLLTVINDILDFSKIEAERLQIENVEFDPRRAVENVADLLAESAFTKGIELVHDLDTSLPPRVMGDPTRFRQVLTNLAGNAVKFTSSGYVKITARAEASADGEADMLHVEVVDSGVGINDETLPRLFRAFSQAETSTTRLFGGTGLGLVICRRLTELMGGEIGVDSVQGQGSRFHFSVRAGRSPHLGLIPPTELEGKSVLLVVPHPLVRESLVHLLEVALMKVDCVESPDEALALMRRESPDFVLVDNALEQCTGLELCRRVAEDRGLRMVRRILIIPVVDWAEVEDQRSIHAYMHKPVHQAHLYHAILGASGAPETLTADLSPAHVDTVAGSEADRMYADATTRDRVSSSSGRTEDIVRQSSILVVDDNAVNQRVASRMLGKLGYHCDVVGSGEEALEAVRQRAYSVVLMDCEMPGMDGLEATRCIRNLGGEEGLIPIVAMTANAMSGERERTLEAGMNDYLSKPVSPTELGDTLKHWLRVSLERTSANDSQADPAMNEGGRHADLDC